MIFPVRSRIRSGSFPKVSSYLATYLHLQCEAESDLNKVGADGVYTQPGGTVYVVGGDGRVLVLEKAESFKGEARFLHLSVDSYYCLAISVTPCR